VRCDRIMPPGEGYTNKKGKECIRKMINVGSDLVGCVMGGVGGGDWEVGDSWAITWKCILLL